MDAIQQKQFELAYYAHTSLNDSDNLYPFELDSFYEKLSKRKKDEADAQEEIVKQQNKAKERQASLQRRRRKK